MLQSILRLFTPDLHEKLSPAALQALLECATWCSRRELSSNPLRSPELDPAAILEVPDFSHASESIEAWVEKKRDSYRRSVSWINQTRSDLLKRSGIARSATADVPSESKLLRYEPLETVEDGAADVGSMGFFDLRDAPPWDTWFLYANDAIFCFIPDFAIPRAQGGIDANPVDCIHWVSWSELARSERL